MSIDCATHAFSIPKKEIHQAADLQKWADSEAYQDIMGFLLAVNTAVRGQRIPAPSDETNEGGGDTLTALVRMLDTLSSWADQIAPVDQPQRFGNKAFRTFFQRLEQEAEAVLRAALPAAQHRAVPELAVYLTEAVGNATRIDYGTGHELAFVMLLCCLCKVHALTEADLCRTGLVLFNRYLRLVRQLQLRYRMEPAGSQGVWSLDDYQFVSFIWGSAQLMEQRRVSPRAITKPDMVDALADDYMFFSCIQHILQVKTGPFAEHSNQLWNISAVPLWAKVNSGLLKMYRGEVLCKHPVIQHCRFGSLLRIRAAPAAERHHQLVIPPPPPTTGASLLPTSRVPPLAARPPVGVMPHAGVMSHPGVMPPAGATAPAGVKPPTGTMPPPSSVPSSGSPGATCSVGNMPPPGGVPTS